MLKSIGKLLFRIQFTPNISSLNTVCDLLSNCFLFFDLSHSLIQEMSEIGEVKRFKENDVILALGDPSSSLVIILKGIVKESYSATSTSSPLYDVNYNAHPRIRRAGDALNCFSFVQSIPNAINLVAVSENVTIFQVDQPAAQRFFALNPLLEQNCWRMCGRNICTARGWKRYRDKCLDANHAIGDGVSLYSRYDSLLITGSALSSSSSENGIVTAPALLRAFDGPWFVANHSHLLVFVLHHRKSASRSKIVIPDHDEDLRIIHQTRAKRGLELLDGHIAEHQLHDEDEEDEEEEDEGY